MKVVCVFNAFDNKEDLKHNGFSWHSPSKSWKKEVEDADVDSTLDEVLSFGVKGENVKVVEPDELESLKAPAKEKFVPAEPNEFSVKVLNGYMFKDKLKADGYHWHQDTKCWFKNFDSSAEANMEASRIKEYGIEEDNIEI